MTKCLRSQILMIFDPAAFSSHRHLIPPSSRPTVISAHRCFNGTIYIIKQNHHQTKHIYSEVKHEREQNSSNKKIKIQYIIIHYRKKSKSNFDDNLPWIMLHKLICIQHALCKKNKTIQFHYSYIQRTTAVTCIARQNIGPTILPS